MCGNSFYCEMHRPRAHWILKVSASCRKLWRPYGPYSIEDSKRFDESTWCLLPSVAAGFTFQISSLQVCFVRCILMFLGTCPQAAKQGRTSMVSWNNDEETSEHWRYTAISETTSSCPQCNRHSGNNPFRKTVAVHPLNTKSRCSWKPVVLDPWQCNRIHLHSGYRTPFVYHWGLILDENHHSCCGSKLEVKVHWPNSPSPSFHKFFPWLAAGHRSNSQTFWRFKGRCGIHVRGISSSKMPRIHAKDDWFQKSGKPITGFQRFLWNWILKSTSQVPRMFVTMVYYGYICVYIIQSVFTQHFADAT